MILQKDHPFNRLVMSRPRPTAGARIDDQGDRNIPGIRSVEAINGQVIYVDGGILNFGYIRGENNPALSDILGKDHCAINR
jgi:hypothetical protein